MNGRSADPERWGPSLGPVVLDIGGEFGALVVVAPPHMEGVELEIRRPPEPWTGRHVAVRSRAATAGATCAAVFGRLVAGPHELRVRGDEGGPPQRVVVRGGDVVWHPWVDGPSCRPAGAPHVHAQHQEERSGQHTENTEHKEHKEKTGHRGKEHTHAG